MSEIIAGTWQIDPAQTEVGFTVRRLMSKVRGRFEEFDGTITTSDNLADSAVTATIQLASLNTGATQRDDHLRSGDFFSVEEHPNMTFASTGVKSVEDGAYVVTGDLTIKGATRPVEVEVELLGVGSDPWGGTRIGLEAKAEISRKEFGVDFNIPVQGDKVMIGDRIAITISAEAVLQA